MTEPTPETNPSDADQTAADSLADADPAHFGRRRPGHYPTTGLWQRDMPDEAG